MKRPVARYGGFVALLALFALLPGRAGAQGPPPARKIVVLDLVPRGVPLALGRELTGVVRRTVGRNPRYLLGPAPALRLRPMMLALGCVKLDPACLGRIGRQLDTELVLHGEVGRTPTGYLVRLQLLEIATTQVLRTNEREVASAEGRAALDQATRDTTSLALGVELRLQVTSRVEGAVVLVNGQPVGTTPLSVTEGLRLGTNDVSVRLAGYKDFVTKVSLAPGQPVSLRAELQPLAPGPPLAKKEPEKKEPEEKSPPVYKRWWFWTALGVVVTGAATAAILGTRGDSAPRVGVEF